MNATLTCRNPECGRTYEDTPTKRGNRFLCDRCNTEDVELVKGITTFDTKHDRTTKIVSAKEADEFIRLSRYGSVSNH